MTDNPAQTADSLFLYSRNQETIEELKPLARALLFAELSMISYHSEQLVNLYANQLNFDKVIFYEKDGSQAYSFINETDHVIACRGTEPNEWNDLKADIDATAALAETVGRVHRGFKQEVDDIWPVIEESIKNNRKNLWFTGHSLGGAMATICASRCLLSHIYSVPEQIQTFGSPRVGNMTYINHTKVDYMRWVNNNDIVTRVPPVWTGYRHAGTKMYLNSQGKLTTPTVPQLAQDRWKGFISGLRNGTIDYFSDHQISVYVDYIYQEAKAAGEIE
jgi:triacylglycerol lipase